MEENKWDTGKNLQANIIKFQLEYDIIPLNGHFHCSVLMWAMQVSRQIGQTVIMMTKIMASIKKRDHQRAIIHKRVGKQNSFTSLWPLAAFLVKRYVLLFRTRAFGFGLMGDLQRVIMGTISYSNNIRSTTVLLRLIRHPAWNERDQSLSCTNH